MFNNGMLFEACSCQQAICTPASHGRTYFDKLLKSATSCIPESMNVLQVYIPCLTLQLLSRKKIKLDQKPLKPGHVPLVHRALRLQAHPRSSFDFGLAVTGCAGGRVFRRGWGGLVRHFRISRGSSNLSDSASVHVPPVMVEAFARFGS